MKTTEKIPETVEDFQKWLQSIKEDIDEAKFSAFKLDEEFWMALDEVKYHIAIALDNVGDL